MFHTFCLCTALYTERFEPPQSLSMSKKKLGHIANLNILSYIIVLFYFILNLVEKLFYKTVCAMCRVLERTLRQLPSYNMLKDLGYILKLSIFHIMLLNLVKKSFLYFLFCVVFIALSVLCAGCVSDESLNHLHRPRLRKNLEALPISVFSSLS